MKGDVECLKALLDKGSDVTATDQVCDECDEQRGRASDHECDGITAMRVSDMVMIRRYEMPSLLARARST